MGFPSTKSPPVTPKLSQRPLSYQQQPVSLLESRVLASIIHNEANRGRGGHRPSRSTHNTPVAVQKSQHNIDYNSLGSEARSEASTVASRPLEEADVTSEEYTKLLRRRMISEVLKPQKNDIWLKQPQKPPQPPQPPIKKRPRSRSQSGQRSKEKVETQSEVNLSPRKPGLGRRSATQLELSRRKRDGEVAGIGLEKSRWHSQEHLDTVSFFNIPIVFRAKNAWF